jgi:hypothetical protein
LLVRREGGYLRTLVRLSASIVAAACLPCFVEAGIASEATTRIYSQQGKQIGSIHGGPEEWDYGTSTECWLERGRGRRFIAGFTHSSVGAAVPISLTQWKVWEGSRLYGTIRQQSRRRWNLFNRRGYFVGYTSGRDGVAAGLGRLVFGTPCN